MTRPNSLGPIAAFIRRHGLQIEGVLLAVICAACLVFVLFHVVLIAHVFPQADDLCLWAQRKANVSIQEIVFEAWNGRALANLLILSPVILADALALDVVWATRAILWFNLACFLVACWVAIGLAVHSRTRFERFALALGMACIFLLNAYSTNQGFFWLSGASNYIAGILALMFLVGGALRLGRGEQLGWIHGIILIVAAGVFSFLHAVSYTHLTLQTIYSV